MDRRRGNILQRLDWWTLLLFAALAIMGWFAIHSVESGTIVSAAKVGQSGKQVMWMGISLFVGLFLLCIPKHTYRNLSFILYSVTLAIGFLTIFIATEIKGSRSWISAGSFSIQPAEFMKFATALMLATYIGRRDFKISNNHDFIKCVGIIVLPMLIILAQKETGSALVYLSMFLVLYREGMTGIFLLTAVSAIVYFVVGVKYGGETMEQLSINIGQYAPTVIIQIISIAIVKFWSKDNRTFGILFIANLAGSLLSYWIAVYLVEFNIMAVQYALLVFNVIYLLLQARLRKEKRNMWVAVYIVLAIAFNYSCNYIMHHVMQPHQKERIEVLFGLKEDLNDAGYNVHQSKIAIGSGGITGRDALNCTQTKLGFVPESDTDFIFCSISEGQGFVGSSLVMLILVILILRIVHLAERQNDRFGRAYGYAIASIFFLHFTINLGMVLGITPVIGIPLPFISYGGSSFLGFTILLFIFLRIDAERETAR
ncbi:MAG: rod shape-determining protein RodA [Bacteroidaceae bacterium]|nr:rod shape-determining protein RodA [Bacteroidaceae bacterium]